MSNTKAVSIKGISCFMNGEIVTFGGQDCDNNHCDVCGRDNDRTKVYHVEMSDGSMIQVGHSCLFRAGLTEDKINSANEFYSEGFWARSHDTKRFIAECASAISKWGYVSSKTGLSINQVVDPKNETKLVKTVDARFFAGLKEGWQTEVESLIAECLEFAKNDKSEFAQNLAAICRTERFLVPLVNVAAYIPEYVNKQREKRDNLANGRFVGAVGEKINMPVEFVAINATDGYYGVSYFYTFKDANGNLLGWKTATNLHLTKGAKCQLTGKIKELNEWQGVKKTMLERCKIVTP